MRTDEEGRECPATLGEYREMCEAIGIKNNAAVKFLDHKIESQGPDELVVATDEQMRQILMPMLMHE